MLFPLLVPARSWNWRQLRSVPRYGDVGVAAGSEGLAAPAAEERPSLACCNSDLVMSWRVLATISFSKALQRLQRNNVSFVPS